MSLTLDFEQLQKIDKMIESKAAYEKELETKATEIWSWIQNFFKTDTYKKIQNDEVLLYKSPTYELWVYKSKLYTTAASVHRLCEHFDTFFTNCNQITLIHDHIRLGNVYDSICETPCLK